jgi:hypothetical protein
MSTHPLFSLTQAGRTLAFANDGTVAIDGQIGSAGTWRTDATGTNTLQFALPGVAPVTLPVTYSLNINNQLVLDVPANAAAETSAAGPITLQGRILVEENKNLTYYLIDDDGWDSATHLAFYVYGKVTIDPAKNQLTITDEAGSILTLNGHAGTGSNALAVGQGNNSLDLIRFTATTHNPLPGGGATDVDADISLLGNWDLQDGQVTFVTNLAKGPNGTGFSVALVGQLKGVAAGFEFSTDGDTPQVLFTIQGRIIGADRSGNWQLSLGYADKRFTASLKGAATYKVGGNVIGITGNLQIGMAAGGGYSLAMDLKAQWTLANGQFNFSVTGTNNQYALALSGDLKIDDRWNVTFAIACDNNGVTSLSLTLDSAAPGSPMNAKLKLFFDGHKKAFGLSLSLTLNFVAGTLVP